MTRNFVAGLMLGVLVLGWSAEGRAQRDPGREVGLALGAAALNLLYVPAKAIVALGGLFLGGLTALGTGGDARSAYALWVPAASGTYILRPAQLEGAQPIEFFGSDYADMPSSAPRDEESSKIYDALYKRPPK